MKKTTQAEINDFMRETARLGINMTKLGIIVMEKLESFESRLQKLEGKKK